MDLNRPIDTPILNRETPHVQDKMIGPTESEIEVPYTDYKRAHLKPFSVDYFDLGENWEQGYNEEVVTIEDYFKRKINNGDLANSVDAIKHQLQEFEKLHNLEHEPRAVIKVGTLAAYMKFLLETEGVKRKMRKYGTG